MHRSHFVMCPVRIYLDMDPLRDPLDGLSPTLYVATLSEIAHPDGLHPAERELLDQRALPRQRAFWAADAMVWIERADDGWLLHPSWPIQHLAGRASGVRAAIAVRTRRLDQPARLRSLYLVGERSGSSVEFGPVDETEHVDVLLTGHFKVESRALRHTDWRVDARARVGMAGTGRMERRATGEVVSRTDGRGDSRARNIRRRRVAEASTSTIGGTERKMGGNRNDHGTPTPFRDLVTDQSARGCAARPDRGVGHVSRRSSSPASLSLPRGARSSANPHSDYAREGVLERSPTAATQFDPTAEWVPERPVLSQESWPRGHQDPGRTAATERSRSASKAARSRGQRPAPPRSRAA